MSRPRDDLDQLEDHESRMMTLFDQSDRDVKLLREWAIDLMPR